MHSNRYLQNSWNKHGQESFEFLILEKTIVKHIDDKERYYIKKYGTYNIQGGGEGSKKLSEETKEKLRVISTINNNKPEIKKKISESSIERWKNEAYRNSVIQKLREVAQTEQSLKRYSENSKKAWKGNNLRRREMSERFSGSDNINARKVVCTNTGEVFETIKDAGVFYNIKSYLKISYVCSGKRQYCGKLSSGEKLHWTYFEKYSEQIEYKIKKRSEIICLNTGQIFESIKKASLYCNIKQSCSVYNNCMGKTAYCGKHPITNEKLHWEYLDDYEEKNKCERWQIEWQINPYEA